VADTSLAALIGDLLRAGAEAKAKTQQVIDKTAADIERDAKRAAPVDTGNLRSSISTATGVLSAEIGPTAAYGGFVERGTSRAGPQPYLRPAYDRAMPNFERALARLADI
jgi:HK97 gp10 family phage protein